MNLFSKLLIVVMAIITFSCDNEKDLEVNSTKTNTTTALAVTPKKFLFDATKAETAGNADWVIDADTSPQRFPTPAQSNITDTTTENFWRGGLSAWGVALVKLGHTVETLPSGTAITYGGTGAQDLKNYDVYVITEPNIRFTSAEKKAIINFVKNGGGLFMIANHNGSDRNNDGYDSAKTWNDLMSNNTVKTNPFGITITLNSISETTSNRLSTTTNTILNGSQGTVTQLKYSAGATMSINTTANSTVRGLIWRGSSTQGSSNIMCASATYGTGRVVAIGDSSPADDGTGAAGDTLYPGWTELSSHSILHLNASLWLAKL
ncbi:hydrolase [Flavobacterium sp. IMCC34852]|uniref:Hydrolase n=1 Tax=Flavobacterium rivulicola TaxID=2732161 RepID=A0A7Y3VYX1_9FLAO|nr:hydrolase [Flavobacterium sp. IMCC34852]NNT72123.1 hydrolase [Flavobacterium sp. IMCC34852]